MITKVLTLIITLFVLVICSPTLTALAQSDEKPLAGYKTLIVQKVVVQKTNETEKFPAFYNIALERRILEALRKKMLFSEIIDATDKDVAPIKDKNKDDDEDDDDAPETDPQATEKQLILATTIIEYNPGNKTLRSTVGLGTGAVTLKARFIVRNAGTDDELLILTQEGKFPGIADVFDSNRNRAVNEAADKVVNGLIRAIQKVR